MKNTLIIILFLLVSSAQAEDVSVDSLITHNKHLLYGTNIGKTLRHSKKKMVREMYKKSHNLYVRASSAGRVGSEIQARSLAYKSIDIFYAADRVEHIPTKHRVFKDVDEEDYVW